MKIGEVDNTQQCIDAVRDHAETTRVFTFGIGAVSFHFKKSHRFVFVTQENTPTQIFFEIH